MGENRSTRPSCWPRKAPAWPVLRGIESYGASNRLHTANVLRLAEHMPLVIEIVDSEEKIETFPAPLDKLLQEAGGGGLVTLEAVEIISYPPNKNR